MATRDVPDHLQSGPAPVRLGTNDLGNVFECGLTRVRRSNRVFNAAKILALYSADFAPEDDLVAELLLNNDSSTTAVGHLALHQKGGGTM